MSSDTTAGQVAEIEAVVTEAIAGFGVDADQIAPEVRLAALEIDSLDLAELTQIIQDRFGVEIVPDDAKRLDTVGDVVELVQARL